MKAFARVFDDVTRQRLSRRRRMWLTLLREWPHIAGAAAGWCRPEKLGMARGAEGAILTLRVAPGRALQAQHMADELIGRINTAFGTRLVDRLRVHQAPLETPAAAPPPAARPVDPARLAALREKADGIADSQLRESLRRLARAVAAGKSGNTRKTP
ncbi:MAG TPA: DUF721 domain-containing protein [Thermopetrobacter sp.]|nr:DUF721 domain-containing protein [Thermopetrobacter sp.]